VNEGDRIAQLICEKICCPPFCETNLLNKTERGTACFGSTGGTVVQKSLILKERKQLDNICSICKFSPKIENSLNNLCSGCTKLKTWFDKNDISYEARKEFYNFG
jgi:hypothetical protein